MNSISSLTLEIYIVQGFVLSNISNKLNNIFPLNLFIAFLTILFLAFFIRIFANIILQTFNGSDYNWKSILLIKMK
jgi:hypothetical protein